jgi:hypothetical protein
VNDTLNSRAPFGVRCPSQADTYGGQGLFQPGL